MNIEFKNATMKTYCAFTDERIVVRDETLARQSFYPYGCIASIKFREFPCHISIVEKNGKFLRFFVEKADRQRIKDAIAEAEKLIKTAPPAESEVVKIGEVKIEIDPNKEYRKRCNVCGNIFCFTGKDIEMNEENKKMIANARTRAVLNALVGTTLQSSLDTAEADRMNKNVRNFNKCPRCNSSDLSEITQDEFIASSAIESNAQSYVSSADEIKKFKELLDAGAITQEEFDIKKKQLLGM